MWKQSSIADERLLSRYFNQKRTVRKRPLLPARKKARQHAKTTAPNFSEPLVGDGAEYVRLALRGLLLGHKIKFAHFTALQAPFTARPRALLRAGNFRQQFFRIDFRVFHGYLLCGA